jgi:hypothetical protein
MLYYLFKNKIFNILIKFEFDTIKNSTTLSQTIIMAFETIYCKCFGHLI